jgi:phosphopantetheinyl transferase
LDELANGAFTFTDHFAESGDDLEEQWRKRGKEAQLRQQLATEFGVDPNEIAIMTNEQPQPEVVENGNQPSAITA